jgi:hypothetical protein
MIVAYFEGSPESVTLAVLPIGETRITEIEVDHEYAMRIMGLYGLVALSGSLPRGTESRLVELVRELKARLDAI